MNCSASIMLSMVFQGSRHSLGRERHCLFNRSRLHSIQVPFNTGWIGKRQATAIGPVMATARNSIRPSRHVIDGWYRSGAEIMVTRGRQSVMPHVRTAPGSHGTSDVAALVGAAMGSVFRCGSHDRWPSRTRETGASSPPRPPASPLTSPEAPTASPSAAITRCRLHHLQASRTLWIFTVVFSADKSRLIC